MEIIVKDLNDLPSAARELLPALNDRRGDTDGRGVVALYGGMGAGKTTLVSALMHEMGSGDEVTSPTFALVNDYLVPPGAGTRFGSADTLGTYTPGADFGGAHVYHFDFYRIDSLAEAFDLGYEEYFYSGELCLVEWPEKIEQLLPPDALRLHIEVKPDGSRVISI